MGLPLLNADTVPGYLRERGLLGASDGARIRVTDLSRRNHNLAVEIDGRPQWFIKQIQYNTAEVVASLRREAQCYQAVRQRGPLEPLRALMPRCADFDPANSILVLAFLDGVNAAEAHLRVGPFDMRVAQVLGRLLGTLHRATPLAIQAGASDLLPREVPWVLCPSSSGGYASRRSWFLSLFEKDTGMARALAGLREAWRFDSLIHGDARLENFVFCRPADEDASFDARLVDWELAGIGDAAWDCANVMQHYWAQWTSQASPAPETWNDLVSALMAFRDAYQSARDLGGSESRDLFRRATHYAGARLVQTAYEQFAASGNWNSGAHRSARLARLLLIDPSQALEGFDRCRDAA